MVTHQRNEYRFPSVNFNNEQACLLASPDQAAGARKIREKQLFSFCNNKSLKN